MWRFARPPPPRSRHCENLSSLCACQMLYCPIHLRNSSVTLVPGYLPNHPAGICLHPSEPSSRHRAAYMVLSPLPGPFRKQLPPFQSVPWMVARVLKVPMSSCHPLIIIWRLPLSSKAKSTTCMWLLSPYPTSLLFLAFWVLVPLPASLTVPCWSLPQGSGVLLWFQRCHRPSLKLMSNTFTQDNGHFLGWVSWLTPSVKGPSPLHMFSEH